MDLSQSFAHPRLARRKTSLAGALAAIVVVVSGCQAAGTDTAGPGTAPDELAFQDAETTTTVLETTISTTTTTLPVDVQLGTKTNPFVPLPDDSTTRAVMTETGIVLPVISSREESWLVATPCGNATFVSAAQPLGRAHVVLDAGHGGVEPGAVGPLGTTEKDLNLAVTRRAKELLENAGATVILTRTGDYEITTASRGLIAEAVDPALFVSVHHNGGAPPSGDKPGTIVFTKTGSDESSRFGGVFYETLQPLLEAAAETKRLDYQVYADALDAHDGLVATYDQSVAARDAALVANGQIPPAAVTTTLPSTTTTIEPGGIRLPQQRQLATTTTIAPTAEVTVPVPETLPPPPSFLLEPVRDFKWAGAGNGGVRAWTRDDGRDFLSVLRTSGDVPAALVEFLYVTNPSEEELLIDPAFVDAEAQALAEAITLYFSTQNEGTGFVKDQFGDQSIGGSGGASGCVEPKLDYFDEVSEPGDQADESADPVGSEEEEEGN